MSGHQEIYGDLIEAAADGNPDAPLIMVVDDNQSIAEAIQLTLADRYNVIFCSSMDAALEELNDRVMLVLLDIQMATHDGVECFRRFRAAQPKVKIIFNTAYPGSSEMTRVAEGLDHDGFLYKGDYSSQTLNDTIARVLNGG